MKRIEMVDVKIEYPEDYQGTEKAENLMKIISRMRKMDFVGLPFGDLLHFEGSMPKKVYADTLAEITKEYGMTDDIEGLEDILASEYDREIDIESHEHLENWEYGLKSLKNLATELSVPGLKLTAGCEIDDEQLYDEDGFVESENIFWYEVNDGEFSVHNKDIAAIRDEMYSLSRGAKSVQKYIRGILENLEFKGQLVDSVEDFLDESGVKSIPSSEEEKKLAGDMDDENAAIIYGADFDRIADSLITTIRNWIDSDTKSKDSSR